MFAAVPQAINYQGKLADASGNPLTGTYSFQFRLCATPTAGDPCAGGLTEIWANTGGAGPSITVVNGIYNVAIGSYTPGGIPESLVDNNTQLYLEVAVQFGAGPVSGCLTSNATGCEILSPREPLSSSLWALHALSSEKLAVGASVATMTASGFVSFPSGAAFAGGVTASSATLTNVGGYSLQVSSGILMSGPALFNAPTSTITAAEFIGNGAGLTGLNGTLSGGTLNDVAVWSGANTLTTIPALGNGGLIIGATGGAPSTGTIAGTSPILVTNSAGAIGVSLTAVPSTLLPSTVAYTSSLNIFTTSQTIQGTNAVLVSSGIAAVAGNAGLFVSTSLYVNGTLYGNGGGLTGLNGTLSGGTLNDVALWSGANTLTTIPALGNGGLVIGAAGGAPSTGTIAGTSPILVTNSAGAIGVSLTAVPSTLLPSTVAYTSSLNIFTASQTIQGTNAVLVSSGIATVPGNAGVFVSTSLYVAGTLTANTINGTLSGSVNANQVSPGAFQAGAYSFPGSATFVTSATVSGSAFSVGGSTLVVAGGNVGVGTANPLAALHIAGANAVLMSSGIAATPGNLGLFVSTSLYVNGTLYGNGGGLTGLNGTLSGGALNDVALWSGANTLTTIPALGNGGLIIGAVGGAPSTGTIAGTSPILVTNSAGAIGVSLQAVPAALLPSTVAYTSSLNVFTASQTIQGANAVLVSSGIATVAGNAGLFVSTSLYVSGNESVSGNLNVAGTITGNVNGTVSGNVNAYQVNAGSFTGANYNFLGNVGVSTGTAFQGLFQVGNGTLTVLQNGSVGIGTANPNLITAGSTALEVAANGDYFSSLGVSRSGGITKTNRIWQLTVTSPGGVSLRDANTGNNPFQIEAGAPNNSLYANSGGNIGVGTTGPNGALEVSSPTAGGTTAPILIVSTGAAASQRLMVVQGNGNVGVGTTGPKAAFDVEGTNAVLMSSGIATVPGNAGLFVSTSLYVAGTLAANTISGTLSGSVSANQVSPGSFQAGAYSFPGSATFVTSATVSGSAFSVGGSTLVVAGGNVGVGTGAPAGALDVENSGTNEFVVGGSTLVVAGGAVFIGTTPPSNLSGASGEIELFQANPAGSNNEAGITIRSWDASGQNNEPFINGYYADGTPTAPIAPTAGEWLMQFGPGKAYDGGPGGQTSCTGPGARLINGYCYYKSAVMSYVAQDNWTSTDHASMILWNTVGTNQAGNWTQRMQLRADGQLELGPGAINGGLPGFFAVSSNTAAGVPILEVSAGGASQDILDVLSSGNVGIGTAVPGHTLDVYGNVYSTGTLILPNAGAPANGYVLTAAGTSGLASWQPLPGGASLWQNPGGSSVIEPNPTTNNVVIPSTLTVQGSAFSVGGSTFVVSGGNVGIGKTGPQYALDVLGQVQISTTGNIALALNQTALSTNDNIYFSNGANQWQAGVYSGGTFGFFHSQTNNTVLALNANDVVGVNSVVSISSTVNNNSLLSINVQGTSNTVPLTITNAGTDSNIGFDNNGGTPTAWQIGDSNGQFRFFHQSAGSIPLNITSQDVVAAAWGLSASTMTLNPQGSAPAGQAGMLYYDSGQKQLFLNNGSVWQSLATSAGGTVSGNVYAYQVNAGSFTGANYNFLGNVGVSTGTAFQGLFQVGNGTLTVTSAGNVGIGTANPQAALDINGGPNDNGVQYTDPSGNTSFFRGGALFVTQYGGGAGYLVGAAANGTATSPTASLNGNQLASLGGKGYNGTAFTGTSARMLVQAAENWTASANGAQLLFQTVPTGSPYTQRTTRMAIGANGDVTISTNDVTIANGHLFVNAGANANPDGFYSVQNAANQQWLMVSQNSSGNFLVTDQTHASVSPFEIEPRAPTGSLYIKGSGNIGVQTTAPNAALEVSSPAASGTINPIFIVSTGSLVSQQLFKVVGQGDAYINNGGLHILGNNSVDQDGFVQLQSMAGQQWLAVTQNNSLGNGPNGKFLISDGSHGNINPFQIEPSAPTNSFYISSVGNVGISTAIPQAKFDVEGASGPNYAIKTSSGISLPSGAPLCWGSSCQYSPSSGGGSSSGSSGQVQYSNGSGGFLGAANLLYNSGTGYVGVSTSAPVSPFAAVGNNAYGVGPTYAGTGVNLLGKPSFDENFVSTNGVALIASDSPTQSLSDVKAIILMDPHNNFNNAGPLLQIGGTDGTNSLTQSSQMVPFQMYIGGSRYGMMNIGNINDKSGGGQSATFHVAANGNFANALLISSANATTDLLVVRGDNGNVGISTDAPAAKLDVEGATASNYAIQTSSGILLGGGGICWGAGNCQYSPASGGATSNGSSGQVQYSNGSGGFLGAANLVYSGGNVGVSSAAPNAMFVVGTATMVATAAGNVGIGTTNPTQQLQLTGNIALPATTASAGIIYMNGAPWIHSYGEPGVGTANNGYQNFFAGYQAGNLSMGAPNNVLGEGIDNTGVGLGALGALAISGLNSAQQNSAFGASALSGNTSGSYNTGVGVVALRDNQAGAWNSALGAYAMIFMNGGSYNTAVGDYAGSASGSNFNGNSLFGASAGKSLTSGSYNTILGYNAGLTPTTASNVVLIGSGTDDGSNASNFLNIGNTLYGTNLGQAGANVGIGTAGPLAKLDIEGASGSTYAILASSSIHFNTAGTGIVWQDGSISTTAAAGGGGATVGGTSGQVQYNNGTTFGGAANLVYVGNNVGVSSATPNAMFVVGTATMVATSGGNVGIGTARPNYSLDVYGSANVSNPWGYAQSGAPVLTSSNTITFVGAGAGAFSSGASEDVFVGVNAGNQNTSGGFNTFVGYYAGRSNVTSGNNTFLGAQAGLNNTAGNGNSFMGSLAGNLNTTGASNTFLGYQAGLNNTTGYGNSFVGNGAGLSNTAGLNNAFLGSDAGYNNTGSGNIVIGANVNAPLAGGNNQLDIGGLIYGTGLGTAGANVGISTGAPAAALDVENAGTNEFVVGGSTLVVTNGKIGIGNANPSFGWLDMMGVSGTSAGISVTRTDNGEMLHGVAGDGSAVTIRAGGGSADIGAYTSVPLRFVVGNAAKMLLDTSGNLGIGTLAPLAKLDIEGANGSTYAILASSSIHFNTAGTGIVWQDGSISTTAASGGGGASQWQGPAGSPIYYSNSVGVSTGAGFAGIFDVGNGTMTILANGNVGISTTSPDNLLQVKGLIDFNAGTNSAFLGIQAGGTANTGVQNTAVGYQALNVVTSGNLNTAVGAGALSLSNTTGAQNTAVGANAILQQNGSRNTAVGYSALAGGTGGGSGSDNVAVGYQALYNNASGARNTIIGDSSGVGIANTNDSTALGYQALAQNNAGFNTVVGDGAGSGSGGTVQTQFAQTTMVGYHAGYNLATNLTFPTNDIFIGYNAGANELGGGNDIVIGANQNVAVVGAGNFLDIGGAIYGNLSSGNIGISTAAPAAALDVENAGANEFIVGGSTLVVTNGRVGISSAAPAYPLVVNAQNAQGYSLELSSGIYMASGTIVANIVQASSFNAVHSAFMIDGVPFIDSTRNLTVQNITVQGTLTSTNTVSSPEIAISTIDATSPATPFGGVNVTTSVFVGGQLGIGTTAPLAKLDVEGASGASYAIKASSGISLPSNAPICWGASCQYAPASGGGGSWSNSGNNYTSGSLGVSTSAAFAGMFEVGSGTLTVLQGGNVGISTATASIGHTLEVGGSINAQSVSINGVALSAGASGNWTLVSNKSGTYNNPPLFSGLSLSTHRAYLLTYTFTLVSGGSPGYLDLQGNGGSPANTATQYVLTYSSGSSPSGEGSGSLSNPRICKTNHGIDTMEITGWVYIWLPVNSGFPHFQAECTTYDNSNVNFMEFSQVAGRFYLGSGNDLTSLQALSSTDGIGGVGNGSQFSLYQAQ